MTLQERLTAYQERQKQLQTFIKETQEKVKLAEAEFYAIGGAISVLNDLIKESTQEQPSVQETPE